MVFPRFFKSRRNLALMVLIVILLGGGLTAVTLAVRHYLEAPLPTVEVSASYPGANAQVLAETVAVPVEREVAGVEGMVSMSRQCTDDGVYRLTITFGRGTDMNIAQVLVQNRVSLALPLLPDPVKGAGITVVKQPTHWPRH